MAFCDGGICRDFRRLVGMVESPARATADRCYFCFPYRNLLLGLCCSWVAHLGYSILKTKKLQSPKKKPEFHEGVEAKKKFERTMKALFEVPKIDSKKIKKARIKRFSVGRVPA
jgi:hypothetical protein